MARGSTSEATLDHATSRRCTSAPTSMSVGWPGKVPTSGRDLDSKTSWVDEEVHNCNASSGLRPPAAMRLGFCGTAGRSEHLSVLAVATADPSGTITLDTSVPAVDAGAGRIVIVYASPAPVLITACADL